MLQTKFRVPSALREELRRFPLDGISRAAFDMTTPREAWLSSALKGFADARFPLDIQYWSEPSLVCKLREWKRLNVVTDLDYLTFVKGALWYRSHKIFCN